MWNTSGRSLIPLSTRSTSLTTGSCSISTSRMIPKPSPVKRCWVRVLWTMLHHKSSNQTVWGFLFAVAPPRQMWYTQLSSTNRNLKGAFSMASKKVEMYAKKRYELDEIKNKIKEEFDKRKFSDVEFKDEIIRELGDTKTLLLIFENWFLRTGSYASLVIMLSEYQGYQSADIIATGGKEAFFSFGAEGDFAKFGEDALKNLGFQGKVR